MSSVRDFITQLEQVAPEAREALWATTEVEGTVTDWREAHPEDPELSRWVSLRWDAGPPGRALPTPGESFRAVLTGEGGPAEAYVVIFHVGPLPPDVPLLTVLVNATGCSLKGGLGTLAAWLLTRSTLARVNMGEFDNVWSYQELPTREGRRHPELRLLGLLDPLREHEALLRSGWLRLAIDHLWPSLGVPAAPRLPALEGSTSGPLVHFLEDLRRVGAYRLAVLAEELLNPLVTAHLERWAGSALLADLRRRALVGGPPPAVETLPEDFPDLARALTEAGETEAARLAGLLLHAQGGSPTLAAVLVTHTARASDLPVLVAGFADTELRPLFEELGAACSALPEALADALVATALPRHERTTQGMQMMESELDRLEALELDPDGMTAHAIKMVRQIRDDRAAEHAAVRPQLEALERSLETALARLGTPSSWSPADIKRAAAEVRVPALTLPLLELAQERARGDLETLVLSLALLSALRGAEQEARWAPGFRFSASTALWGLGDVRLFELRLHLLDALIAQPGDSLSRAELYFQRANTRRAWAGPDPQELEAVHKDLEEAARWAQRRGELEFLADAVASLAYLQAQRQAQGQSDASTTAAIVERVHETLALPVPPGRRALLFQGLAHLVRADDPERAVAPFAEAVACLPPEDPFWLELQAERIHNLLRLRRVEAAAALVDETLAAVRVGTSEHIVSMVHSAVGEVKAASGELDAAREHFERALEGMRGIDRGSEHVVRLKLAKLGIHTKDLQLFNAHFKLLRSRWERLRPTMRTDLVRLAHDAARAGLLPQEEANELAEVHSPEPGGLDALRLRLRQARLRADAGDTAGLGPLLLSALEEEKLKDDVVELASNHSEALATDELEALLARAREWRDPTMEARLLEHLGRPGEARRALREALSKHQSPLERLSCTHLLVTLFEDHQAKERLRWCEELEELLETGEDHPIVRIDLAAALQMSADGDPSLLDRAWRHAQRALPGLRGERQVQQGHRILGRIAVKTAQRAFGAQHTVALERARWLLGPHPLKPSELAHLRLVCAQHLVVPGPLADPVSIEISEKLLAEAEAVDPGHSGVAGVMERCRWVHQRRAGGLVTADPHFEGPGDGLADWLIAAVMGRRVKASDAELAEGLDLVNLATQVRPDQADPLCAFIIRKLGSKGGGARLRALQLVHEQVKGPTLGEGAWAQTEAALGKVKRKKRHPLMESIVMEIRRSRGEPIADAERARERSRRKGTAEDAHADWVYGVELMRVVHSRPFSDEAEALIQESRERLTCAVSVSKRRGLPTYPDYLISLGNAWKMPPNEDVEKALAIYEKAERQDLHPEQLAKLWKVRGDALRHRGRDEDLRESLELLLRSARERSGWLRAESLHNAAGVARVHPDWPEAQRLRRAVELLVEAMGVAPRESESTLPNTLRLLGEWAALAPEDKRPAQLKSELIRVYPERQAEVERPVRLPPKRLAGMFADILQHPATNALFGITMRMMAPEQILHDPFGITQMFGPEVAREMQERRLRESIWRDPEGLSAALADLETQDNPEAAPGHAVARAKLLAELCRLERRALSEVQSASERARSLCATVDPPSVRATLLRELARVWCPNDHAGDPVRDFALTAELAEDAIALEGGEESATSDTLELRARALRYSPEGDLRQNLLEARRVYTVLRDKALAEGNAELAANAEHCLADAESQLGQGGRLARLQAGAKGIERALAMTTNPYKQAEYQSSLAWERTRVAFRLEGPAKLSALQEALELFDAVNMEHLSGVHEGHYHRLNRTTCAGTLAKLIEGRHAEVDTWRRFLEAHNDTLTPTNRAVAQHNLANALLWAEDVTLAEFEEGLALCEQLIKVRTVEANPRHHWETTLLAGGALVQALEAVVRGGGPLPPQALRTQARTWLRRALHAGQLLGPGEELADAAMSMVSLASLTPEPQELMALADEGWAALERAAPYLLLHAAQNEQEAHAALQLGLALSYRLSAQGVTAASDELAFAYSGKRAHTVLDWVARGHAVLRRPLRARLHRPEGVSIQGWMDWQRALRSGDADAVARQLERLHEQAPDFLQATGPLAPTWRWLKGRPGSVAVFVLPAAPVTLALLLRVDARGQESVHALGLRLPKMPVEEDHLAWTMGRLTERPDQATQLHELTTDWAQDHIAGPILRFLGEAPAALLWCPGPGLRTLAPRAIWGALPVVTSTGLALPDLRGAPRRPASTLFVLADPGQGPMSLGGEGRAAIEALAQRAQRRGPVELLASVGPVSGAALEDFEVGELVGPATPEALLDNARDHDVIVVLAHGEAPTPAEASLLLLNASGQLQRLGVAELAARPEALTGATVLLLACESGRVGAELSAPGGIAGALIAAGARQVVAPLWPIQLSVARAVAAQVLEGLERGQAPEEVLAVQAASSLPAGPSLGPAPSLDHQRSTAALQRLAFVTWVG